MNPFLWTGPEFLPFYLVVLVAAAGTAFVVRWCMRLPGDPASPEELDLDPYEVAYLSGGERMCADAAITRLIHRKVLDVDYVGYRLERGEEELPKNAHPVEEAAFEACNPETPISVHQVRDLAAAPAQKLRKRLRELGLVLASRQASLVQLTSACVMLIATAIGAIKIVIGLSDGRPVGYLVVLVILSLVAAGLFFARRPVRSQRGDQALAQLKQENAALGYAAGRRVRDLSDNDLILAMGLFGAGVLLGGPLGPVHAILSKSPPVQAGSSSSGGCNGGSTCGSTSSSSSCGGGGGGCGGGGCGGCGGG